MPPKKHVVRGKEGTSFNDFQKPSRDRLQTNCTVCKFGIFEGQERVWKEGLIHLGCYDEDSESA